MKTDEAFISKRKYIATWYKQVSDISVFIIIFFFSSSYINTKTI
jgi:hypothetical protein